MKMVMKKLHDAQDITNKINLNSFEYKCLCE